MQAQDATPAPADPPARAFDPVRVVEAALFSAGKPLALDELAENTGLPRKGVAEALKALAAEYDARDTSLEVRRAGEKWAMQVRAEYAPATQRLAPMEIPVKLLKTLALIAYHQPVLQSKVIDMVGQKGYDHIHELHERGLVKKRVHERSFMLMTSDLFPEYFGIPASDREEIKVFLANKLGIAVPRTDEKGNTKLGSFAEGSVSVSGSDEGAAGSAPEPDAATPEPDSASAEPKPEPEPDP